MRIAAPLAAIEGPHESMDLGDRRSGGLRRDACGLCLARAARLYGAWASGLIVIGPEARPKEAAKPEQSLRMRLLSSDDVAELLLFAMGDLAADKALGVKGQVARQADRASSCGRWHRRRHAAIGAAARCRPRRGPGRRQLEPRETLLVGGRSLKVVGVLKPGLALFAGSYLVPKEATPTDATNKLFPAEVPSVLHAWLVRASAEDLRDGQLPKTAGGKLPPQQVRLAHTRGQARSPVLLSLSIGPGDFPPGRLRRAHRAFRWLAGKVASPFFAEPLLEMKARPRLVWGVHLLFFGLVIAGSLLIYKLPEAQIVLLSKVREQLATKSSILGIAAEAYQSGSIPRAAAVTLAINFLLGSLVAITLPSIVVPGSGVLVAGLRAFALGMILAPAMQSLAYVMLPHSGTLLLEGEGYILAMLFGLLIPIHIVKSSLGGNPLTRFGRVLLLNLKANVWIALVLAVAAIFEATEVILMNR